MIYIDGFAIDSDLDLRKVGACTYLKVLLGYPSKRISFARICANSIIRQSIALSEVFVFRNCDKSGQIELDEKIYLGVFRLDDELHFYIYPTCINLINQRSLRNNKSLFVLLDLDKTLISSGNTDKNFKADFSINGLSINDDEFNYDIMLRPNVDKFLEFLFGLTPNVYIMTAADIHYAELIVKAANKIGWGGNFKLKTNVFSTKSKTVLLKNIDIVNTVPCNWVAVDDNPQAWEPKVLDKVLQIKPFHPSETKSESETEFTRIMDLIKMA